MASRWPDSLVDETRAVDVPGYGAEWLTLLRCYTQVNAQWTWLIMCNFRDMAIFLVVAIGEVEVSWHHVFAAGAWRA